MAAFSDHRAESALESIGRVVFREYRLPAPELQVWVGGDLGIVGRADYFWPGYRTIAEADGAVKYADPRQAMRQLDRDARLRDAGFEVVHFTWQEITLTPWQVTERIRAAFVRGASGRGASASAQSGSQATGTRGSDARTRPGTGRRNAPGRAAGTRRATQEERAGPGRRNGPQESARDGTPERTRAGASRASWPLGGEVSSAAFPRTSGPRRPA